MSALDFWLVVDEVVRGLTVVATGMFAGAMLTEAGLLVPYWQSLEAAAFHRWYRANASRLVGFFGPLTWLAGLSALASALLALATADGDRVWAVLAAALMLAVVAMFPMYFKQANAGFVAGLSSTEETRHALARWAAWHWVRAVISLAALVAAGMAIR